jgi:histidine ammonia-lyase
MLEFRKPLKPGVGVQHIYELVRSLVPKLEQDRVLAPDMAILAKAVKAGMFASSEYVSRET